jgi:hypothetical protein
MERTISPDCQTGNFRPGFPVSGRETTVVRRWVPDRVDPEITRGCRQRACFLPDSGKFNSGAVLVKKIVVRAAGLVMAGCLSFFPAACSQDPEGKGRIETMTEKAGKDMADRVKAPIDKAEAAKARQEERDRDAARSIPDK